MDPYEAYSNSDKPLECVTVVHTQRSRSPTSGSMCDIIPYVSV
jgi:hypothetical protein